MWNISTSTIRFIAQVVPEDKDIFRVDEFQEYDPDPNEEAQIKAMGGKILDSHIELTDSSGMNRTIVRRQDNNSKWNI
jgi:hypothetical protein